MDDYDVIVVGAGPIGSTYAYKMAGYGYNVAIFDMKNRIGEPLQCAGLVSTNIDKTGNLPREFIINKLKGANLVSPDGNNLTVRKDTDVAYVLDRVLYDKYLLMKAENEGVDVFHGTKVVDVDIKNTTIRTNSDTYRSKIIAVASGPNSQTSRKMNPDIEDEEFIAVQYIVKTSDHDLNYLDLHINQQVLPGFIWSIPVNSEEKRVGLFTDKTFSDAIRVLQRYIKPEDEIMEKIHGTIPKFNSGKKIVENNTILIGDAASQIKPTTGGGLITGFNAAQLAAENSDLALRNNDNQYLKEYEKQYHKMYDSEFRTQQGIQKILKQMRDDDFNYMFDQLKQNNIDKTISEYGDMDDQSILIKQLLKTGEIFKLLPKIGSRRLKNLWKL